MFPESSFQHASAKSGKRRGGDKKGGGSEINQNRRRSAAARVVRVQVSPTEYPRYQTLASAPKKTNEIKYPLFVNLDATHSALKARIEAPDSIAHTPSERHGPTYADEHAGALPATEGGMNEPVDVLGEFGASGGEGDTWREVQSIDRFGRCAGIEDRDAQACDCTLRNERREKRNHGGERS